MERIGFLLRLAALLVVLSLVAMCIHDPAPGVRPYLLDLRSDPTILTPWIG